MGFEFRAAINRGREQDAFGRSNARSDVLKVAVSGLSNFNAAGGVVVASGEDQQIVGKGPGPGIHGAHQPHPWPEEEGDEEHGEGAPLRNAAWPVVGGAKAQTERIEHGEAFEIVAVSIKNGHRHASDHGKVV